MDLGLTKKVALVFGAGGGLGGAIARTLAAEGAIVHAADIKLEAANATVEDIRGAGGEAWAVRWDLADLASIEAHLASVRERNGAIQILINNTGGPPPTPVRGQPAAKWNEYFQSMVLPLISITDQVLPDMVAAKWGRIITSTSSGVIAPIPNLGISNTLRLSLVGWSKTLAREVGPDGVTSNIVLPGRIATGRIKFLDEQKAKREETSMEQVVAESTGGIPLRRYGDPREYGDVVGFLASQRASYITGSVIRVDGGLIASV